MIPANKRLGHLFRIEIDSDAGSENLAWSDTSAESDGELAQEEYNSSDWLNVPKTLPSFKGQSVLRSFDSDDEEEIALRSFYTIFFVGLQQKQIYILTSITAGPEGQRF
ncbi:MAG: hypothetical protein J3R72DRAFT_420987 [Linnemannia gamsii]|nr:MAG: hypothetical protein J3R72DRAFT_420987 [Linnemannia gamsii]